MSALGLPSWTDGHATLTVGLADGAPVVQLDNGRSRSRMVLPRGVAAFEVAGALKLGARLSIAGLFSRLLIWTVEAADDLVVETDATSVTVTVGQVEVKLHPNAAADVAKLLSSLTPLYPADDLGELGEAGSELADSGCEVLDSGVAVGVPSTVGGALGPGGVPLDIGDGHDRSLSGSGSQTSVASDGPAGSGGGAPGSGERTVGDTPDTAPAPMTGAVSGPQTSDEAPDQTPSRGSSASGVVGTFPSGASSEPTECEPASYSGCCCGGCSL